MQCNVVASWHGFAYETVSSDLAMDLTREPKEPRPLSLHQRLASRLFWIIDEINFFGDYSHHVATSDHAGDVLRRVYMLPPDRVHVILNGVDNGFFRPDPPRGAIFRRNFGVPENASLVFGLAGRLVKDKGHPLMFQALIQILKDRNNSGVFVLVAGDGPWGKRYRELGPNILVLGPLERERLAGFYNALDVFVNPTLRAQGLDHTLLEAMASGKPVMATGFASITGSVIVGEEVGYTFSPTVESLKVSLSRVLAEGKGVFDKKGEKARERAAKLFTSAKMAAAYERLFLCLSPRHRKNGGLDFCRYPLPSDQ
ncbi:uncharacterized protein LOC18440216 [Amborella trichopoda]|uniref:Glycosyltransferase subfamily 4-like N-terminal domain-containing protein n=1 Tax=Amborella trichopoda TaxID=13333 RepID=W1PPP5_AMBTC|nr:uncharacterized protein LOC18440216 [Amborella trichopoda]ERN12012.1 hypothetical protein AMTR_s00165p00049730 [Amborella trichopoda]|eukprot:XP_006850431.3 uncharacterized protein LOC18440216 [Amborella trichopoda]